MAIHLKCRKCKKRKKVVKEEEFIEDPTCNRCGGRLEVITRGVPHSNKKKISHLEKSIQLFDEARMELHKGQMKGEIDQITYEMVIELLDEAKEQLNEEF